MKAKKRTAGRRAESERTDGRAAHMKAKKRTILFCGTDERVRRHA